MKNYTLLLLLIFIGTSFSFAQDENPNLDQLPKYLINAPRIFSPFAVLTNSEGYDNFYLGVDFAEPHISIHPANPFWFFTAYNTNATHYTLNGMDWFSNNPNLISPQGDPVTAYDSLGNLYYMNMTGSSITGCYIVRSTNNGQTWGTPVFCINGNDKNWLACDQTGGPYANYVYCSMTSGSGYGNFSRSTDFGQTFSTTFSPNTQSLPGMMVCVGPNVSGGDIPGGCVYVVTNSGVAYSPIYTFYCSTNGGASFTTASAQSFAGYLGTYTNSRPSIEGMRTRPYPFITADNSYGQYRGRLYLVYATNNPNGNGNKPDIYCRYSNDKGVSWSSPVIINDDNPSTGNHQWMPSVWCDKKSGYLFVKWFDTRNCPTSDSAEVYASYSSDGGQTFATNQKIGTSKFKILCSTCGGGGTPTYEGDYDAITSYNKTSMLAWSDFRNGSFGSYTAYFPDYAMTAAPTSQFLQNGDSTTITVKIPSVKLYSGAVKFTAAIDTLPTSGSINLSFANGKDSITSFPDSIKIKVKTTGSIPPKIYGLIITGKGKDGIPVHKRIVNLNINVTYVSVGTSRDNVIQFKVNGVTYTQRQSLLFPIGSTVSVQAVSPYTTGGTRYIYLNWSDGGDTTHNITVAPNMYLTANYKVQFKVLVNSSYGYTYGNNIFYDSSANAFFGVTARHIVYQGTDYYYHGFTGTGQYSYTSLDSNGNDSAVVYPVNGIMVENARWSTTVGINKIGSEIPTVYQLFNNYPNPFNPATKIKFDIPENTFVNLSIFDILGREVTNLVNKKLNAGSYESVWDASSLNSGIYFYRLKTESYTSTKRMVLLK